MSAKPSARKLFRKIESREIKGPSAKGCRILFSGHEYRGRSRDYWRERLGWKGEKRVRYEAVGNLELKEYNSSIRFSWDWETGQWMPKSEWLEKMKWPTGSRQGKGKVKAKGNDKATGGSLATCSGCLERDCKVVTFVFEEGAGGQSSAEEQSTAEPKPSAATKRKGADAPVAGPSVQRPGRGVNLGAKRDPESGDMAAEAGLVTQRKSSPETSTTTPPELTPGANPVPKSEGMADNPLVKRRKKVQEPFADEGLASEANISAESEQGATKPPSNNGGRVGLVAPVGGDGVSLGANHALLNPGEEVRVPGRVLRSRVAGWAAPAGVALGTNIVPRPGAKAPKLPAKRGRKPKTQSATTLTATEGNGVAQGPNIFSKPKEQPKRPPARRGRSRKIVPEAVSVGMIVEGVSGDQMVAPETSGVEARRHSQATVVEEEAKEQRPTDRKRKLEESSISAHGETPAETERRPERTRRPPKWYQD
ncbi:hypothetical protein GX50_02459 [[Emmonsia] crescens]|uniref:Uncharacterized protein n=1 Tax=[Emmonsia] crescens TaxID=73230 RepID=A0A2B7ZMS3_9EURO|nr:hypothetical protein GX50_02459 [Emmonsia crescens]